MSTYIRILLVSTVFLALLVFAAVSFPVRSGAQRQATQTAQTTTPRKRQRQQMFVPGEILVRYRNEPMAKSKGASMRIAAHDGRLFSVDLKRTHGSDLLPGLRLARVAPEETLDAVTALRQQPDVLNAEPNYILKADANPNDSRFNEQYALPLMGAPQAWDTRTGSTGAGRVVIGVIDQGIDFNHSDLAANIWINPGEIANNNVDDDGNGFKDDVRGFNFVDNNGSTFSGVATEDHASHVAGIAGAVGNNNNGIAGVNWSVGLMSLRFLDEDGFGSTSDAIDAIQYARTMRNLWDTTGGTKGANIRVLNASFGGALFSQQFLDAINQANAAGLLFVAAAGNVDNGTIEPNNDLVPHFPSNFDAPNIISVAASNSADALASFSHFGATTVDIAAPGSAILSTTPNNTYSSFSGTSMAAPQVSGAAALLWAQNPNLTVQQVKNLLMADGNVITGFADKIMSQRRLNVGNSMAGVISGDVTPPGTVGSFHINSQNGRNLNVGWTASGDDGATGNASLYRIDFTDGGSGQVTTVKGVIPKNSGSLQSVNIRIPFKHAAGTLTLREFDNAGNEGTPATLPVGVPLSASDPYTISVGSSAALTTGGTRNNIDGDDRYVDFALPFVFPFFGENFTELTISTNGNLFFSEPPRRIGLPPGFLDDADDPPGSPRQLGGYKMIAGLWEDIDLRTSERADAGVYITQSANQIIFRWQGVPCNFDGQDCTGGAPINFEIELNSNGVIRSRYGSGNTSLVPTVGLGGGEQDGYVVDSHTSLDEQTPKSLTNAGQVTYTPRAAAASVSSVQLESANASVTETAGQININVTRTGDLNGFATVNYTTSDTAGLTNCQTVNGKASERCDYETAAGTLRFSVGEATKTIIVPIVNDVLVEGSETFTLTLSGVSGSGLGTSTSTITINDNANEASTQNPIDGVDFFVTQQYIDFLGRLPDATGFANWVATLGGCPQGGFGENLNPGCDRVHVSAGFFFSAEFQGRGYFAYRFYEVALDRRPSYAEFVPDMAIVGGPQSPESEVLSKATYTEAWTQRPEFKARYDNMTNLQYVLALQANAEVGLTNGGTLITALDNGQMTRGEVLRNVVENQLVADKFFNRALVTMQYFGYLRRDPDTVGFQNWLDTINADPSNTRHMIFGFLFSTEYRQRFGQ
ncbi:MAG TPA: S8 family serine peptidase [Pyrinomonadaceae bacterium]|nr:S8 family serine peptidase [Pyrinomonadaceae bacterium]